MLAPSAPASAENCAARRKRSFLGFLYAELESAPATTASSLSTSSIIKTRRGRTFGSADSGCISLESSTGHSWSSFPKVGDACPTLPRLSWQKGWGHLESSVKQARHVDLTNEFWASFQLYGHNLSGSVNQASITPRRYVLSPSTGDNLAPSFDMSESIQDLKQARESSASGSYGAPANQPILSLKDSGTMAFPSVRINQPSPTKSDCSEDDSPQTSLQASSSAIMQPLFYETQIAGVGSPPGSSPNNLSGLVSNILRTTGQEPPALVGASTTIVGDKLYVFGGRRLRPQRLTRSLYVLDLVSRHWTKTQMSGDVPQPRFFHTLCALGDTKLVCYGGMALAPQSSESSSNQATKSDTTMTVTSDIHVYDIATQAWKAIPTAESPPRRYAHCATILPSSAVFASPTAPLSALRHNPSSDVPNQGTLGVSIDGRGGAEMIVVGGQDGQSHFIDTIEVFNFRSLKWSKAVDLSKSYGAYRSVVAPLIGFPASRIGIYSSSGSPLKQTHEEGFDADHEDGAGKDHVSGAPVLIFSNYNFLNTRVEVQVRLPDGSLTEVTPRGKLKPPGLRFPNGGVINKHLIVSGTYITSSQQEYMIWAMDLQTLVWTRVDAGGGGFGTGSWNRAMLWSKRNTFVILGDRRRRLNEDYNTRRLNFSNMCNVELEAFGLYENPQRDLSLGLQGYSNPPAAGGSSVDHNRQSHDYMSANPMESLGNAAMGAIELCDMELQARDGERVPVSSQIMRVRWGPYFQQLLREDLTRASDATSGDSNSLHLSNSSIDTSRSRSSIVTVTPTISAISNGTTAVESDASSPNSQRRPSTISNSTTLTSRKDSITTTSTNPLQPLQPPPTTIAFRSRVLYLPHTFLTIRALVHYLYTTALPPLTSPLCTPQILCSLLQLARPYRVPGLLEATVACLHQALDARNTAAVFNAAAMAAGGGDFIHFVGDLVPIDPSSTTNPNTNTNNTNTQRNAGPGSSATARLAGTASRQTIIEDDASEDGDADADTDADGASSASASTASMSDIEDAAERAPGEEHGGVWSGSVSAVVGLQKRGLRGLMEGRRLREQGGGSSGGGSSSRIGDDGGSAAESLMGRGGEGTSSVGLGIG